jgi:hypothetical protein
MLCTHCASARDKEKSFQAYSFITLSNVTVTLQTRIFLDRLRKTAQQICRSEAGVDPDNSGIWVRRISGFPVHLKSILENTNHSLFVTIAQTGGRRDSSASKKRWAYSAWKDWISVGCCCAWNEMTGPEKSHAPYIRHLVAEVRVSPFISSYCYAKLQKNRRIYSGLCHEISLHWWNSGTEINRPLFSLFKHNTLIIIQSIWMVCVFFFSKIFSYWLCHKCCTMRWCTSRPIFWLDTIIR